MKNYTLWGEHGEIGVVIEDGEQDDHAENNFPPEWDEGDAFSDVLMSEGE
jgi:hypothetical protein